LRWGRGCSRVSARPSRDLAEIQPRDSGDPAERQRRDSSLASAIALLEASSLPQDTSQTLPFGGTTRVEGTSCPLHFPDTSKTPLAPLHIPLGGIRVEDTSSPSAGEAILESCRAHESEESPEGLANVRFAQTLSKADAAESAAEYCARVEARIEELMEPVRRERLTRFLLEPDSVDEAEVELACAEPVQLPPS